MCDDQRIIIWAEAKELFRIAIERGMVSQYCIGAFGFPKFVWAVDQNGEAYEAKQGGDGRTYHGYRLNNRDQAMRYEVCREWRLRC